jgi:SHS2 domain-containing protein
MMLHGGFRILEHPADVGIEATGGTLHEAFEQAAVGLTSIILDPSTVGKGELKKIRITGSDREQLLVRFLSEVLYLYDGLGFVAAEVSVTSLSDTDLEATVKGEQFQSGRHTTRLDVKAITYHQISVNESSKGARVRVYLDI